MTESTAGALSQLNLAFGFIAETIEESPTANPVGPPRKGPVDSVELQGGSRLQDEFETIWPRHQGYNPVTPLGTARVKGLTAKQTTHLYRGDLKIRKSGHTMSRLSGSSLGLANSHQNLFEPSILRAAYIPGRKSASFRNDWAFRSWVQERTPVVPMRLLRYKTVQRAGPRFAR
jgi:hypothetical protein